LKRTAALLTFLLIGIFCKGQPTPDSITIHISDLEKTGSLLEKTVIYIDSSSSLTFSEVLQKSFSKPVFVNERIKIAPNLVTATYYLKILLNNNTPASTSVYVFPGIYFSSIKLYKIGNQPVIFSNSNENAPFKKIVLTPGEKEYFLLQLKPLKNEFNYINPLLIKEADLLSHKAIVAEHKSDIQIFGLVLSGVLLMMIFFMLTNFILSYKLEFLYNAIYSICMFFLIFFNSSLAKLSSSFNNFYYSYFDFFLLVTGTIFYIYFSRKFLDTKNNHVLLDRILKYGERFIWLLLGIYTYLNFFTATYLPQYYLENSMKTLFLLLGFAFIYLALKRKDRLFNYIAAGNAMLVAFSLISFVLVLLAVKPVEIYQSSLFYYNLGIILELVFFLLGLTYKNRNELIIEIKKQEAFKLESEKKEFESQLAVITAQQEERNRISADMHDDLGAGMTTISLYSELAKTKLANNPIPEIEKISSAANELLNKMNAIIWSMSSSNDSLGNMIAYIRSYAIGFFEDTGVHCKVVVPDKLPNIEVIGTIRRNVFLVVKEALNNVLKHAKATEVSITLVREENTLTLNIHDNGTGIDMNNLRQFGNGLKNMKKRMADIDIDFSIENKNGTLITLSRKVNAF
jgi:signal transduction histidine kinase